MHCAVLEPEAGFALVQNILISVDPTHRIWYYMYKTPMYMYMHTCLSHQPSTPQSGCPTRPSTCLASGSIP